MKKRQIPRPGKLTHPGDVRRELASIYRDARQGRISPQALTRFTYALKVLRDMIVEENQLPWIDETKNNLSQKGSKKLSCIVDSKAIRVSSMRSK